jgi:hypothetical protein
MVTLQGAKESVERSYFLLRGNPLVVPLRNVVQLWGDIPASRHPVTVEGERASSVLFIPQSARMLCDGVVASSACRVECSASFGSVYLVISNCALDDPNVLARSPGNPTRTTTVYLPAGRRSHAEANLFNSYVTDSPGLSVT